MKKQQKQITEFNIWLDPSEPGREFTHEEFMARLREVHGIDPKTTKGTRRLVSHVDAADWYAYNYEWEIDGKKFTQNTRSARSAADRSYWRGMS